jgi:hypothetical protein
MRNFLVLALTLLSFSGMASDKSSGCGVGWMVTKSMTTLGSSTRAITNATFTPSFGMTSGTSGCAKHDLVLLEKAKSHFVANNYLPLQLEIAMGSGERLTVLGKMFGCESGLEDFNSQLRKSHSKIFKSSNPSHVLEEVRTIIINHPDLKSRCVHS